MTPTPPSTVIAGQAKMLEQIMEGYEEPLVDADPDLRSRRPECVQVVMRQAVKRTWDHLAKERLEDTHPAIPLGKRFWPVADEESARSSDFLHRGSAPIGGGTTLPERRRTRRSGRCCILDERVQLPRAAALCGIARGRKKPSKRRRPLQIDIKEAVAGGRAASSTTRAQNHLSGPNPLRPL